MANLSIMVKKKRSVVWLFANKPKNDNFLAITRLFAKWPNNDNYSQSYQNWQIIFCNLIGAKFVTFLPKVSSETEKCQIDAKKFCANLTFLLLDLIFLLYFHFYTNRIQGIAHFWKKNKLLPFSIKLSRIHL